MNNLLQPLYALFQSNKQETIDQPLIVVDIGDTLGSMRHGLNRPLLDRLVEYKQNGAEIIIASDGEYNAVTGFQALLELEGYDPALFSAVLTPATNRHMTKDSRQFWPRLLTQFQRDPRQVLLLDDKETLLHKAHKHGVNTVHITAIPSSPETLRELDHQVAMLQL